MLRTNNLFFRRKFFFRIKKRKLFSVPQLPQLPSILFCKIMQTITYCLQKFVTLNAESWRQATLLNNKRFSSLSDIFIS